MNDAAWNSIITNYCANCQLCFDGNTPKTTELNIVNANVAYVLPTNYVTIPILDALLYVYGLSYEDFAQIFENVDETCKYFKDIGGKEVALCYNCLQVFKDVYYTHVSFENLSKQDALLQKVIKFKSDKRLAIKKEPEFTENNDEDDSNDFLDSVIFNHDNDNTVSDQGLDIKTEFDEPKNDLVNTKCAEVPQNSKIKSSSQKKRSKNVNTKEKVEIKSTSHHPNTAIESEHSNRGDSNLLYARLTRSKISGAERGINARQSYMEEGESNSSSSQDEVVEKQTVKRRKTLKQFSNESLKPNDIHQSKINKETTESTSTESSNIPIKEDGAESKSASTEFVKVVPEGGKRPVYICNLCGKNISRLKVFKIHMNFHKKEANKEKRKKSRKVKCPHCDKVCRNEDSLKIHESKLHSEEPKVCDICGKTFQRLESLKSHQRFSHTEEKPFECKTCGMKYKWRDSLRSHEMTHENPRPHVCEICGVSYTNKSNLNQHKTYHEDEERDKELFRCKECNKVLKNRKSLRSHINRTHREGNQRSYSCPTCGMTTKRKENLTAHMKIVHDPNRTVKRSSKVNKNSSVINESEGGMQQQLQWNNYQA